LREFITALVGLFLLLGVPFLMAVAARGGPGGILAVPAILLFAVVAFLLGAGQTAIEILPAAVLLGRPSRRLFRAWWEGVVISYGACATLLYVSGRAFCILEPENDLTLRWRLWPIWLMNLLVAVATQYFVLRARSRQWPEIPTPRGLVPLIVVTKLLTAAAWLAFPLRLVRV
jgi:hypothetical protein